MAVQDRNDGRTNYLLPGLIAALVTAGLIWMFAGSTMWNTSSAPNTTVERTTPPATTTSPTTTSPPARTTP